MLGAPALILLKGRSLRSTQEAKKFITRALGNRSRRETKAKVIDMWRVALKDALAFH
jgi:hypothetical protein